MNKQTAKTIAESQIVEKLEGFSVINEFTQEFDSCFTFIYQNNQYINTRHFIDMTIGHGPIIVCKKSGRTFATGSAYPIEKYVEAFEACGDPLGELTTQLSIYGWEKRANKVAAVKLLRSCSNLSLKESKTAIDKALNDQQSRVSTSSVKHSAALCTKLNQLGFKSKQLWSNQT